MTHIDQFRLEAHLESLLAGVRPAPTLRDRVDISYRITDEAFIVDILSPVSDKRSAAIALLKGVTFDAGFTWHLLEQREGNWVNQAGFRGGHFV